MTSNINNNNNNMDMFLNLVPPGSEGDPYGNLATSLNGVPIGQSNDPQQTVSSLLGYSNKDTIGSAMNEIIDLAKLLNFSITAFAQGTSQDAVQHFLNNLDPTDPSLPPIKAFITLLERMLQSGNLGNVQIEKNSSQEPNSSSQEPVLRDNTKPVPDDPNAPPPLPSATPNSTPLLPSSNPYSQDGDTWNANLNNLDAINRNVGSQIDNAANNLNASGTHARAVFAVGTGGNPWLAGNVYVTFLVQFMDMQRMLMQNQVVQGLVELMSMQLVTDLAKTTADVIMSVAQQNQMVHIASAIGAGIGLGLSVGGFMAGFHQKIGVTGGQTISSMGSSLTQMISNTAQAATDLQIAAGEGRKEILQAYRQIAQTQMSKAGDAFKGDSDQIAQLLQTLDKIRDDLKQAVQASLNAR